MHVGVLPAVVLGGVPVGVEDAPVQSLLWLVEPLVQQFPRLVEGRLRPRDAGLGRSGVREDDERVAVTDPPGVGRCRPVQQPVVAASFYVPELLVEEVGAAFGRAQPRVGPEQVDGQREVPGEPRRRDQMLAVGIVDLTGFGV